MKTTRAVVLIANLLAILSLLASCANALVQSAPPSKSVDLEKARQTLTGFFAQLNGQHYDQAYPYFGGSYDVLREWNPAIAVDDYASLWRSGCTINGLQCLAVKDIVQATAVSPAEFRFVVEFALADGATFIDTSFQTQFQYTVAKKGGEFLVMEMPIYTP